MNHMSWTDLSAFATVYAFVTINHSQALIYANGIIFTDFYAASIAKTAKFTGLRSLIGKQQRLLAAIDT